jgi:hypothetical protein
MVHRVWRPSPYDPPRAILSANPTPFDPTYATAKVGDQVRFVDWARASAINGNPCSVDRTTAPSYAAQIIAIAGDAAHNVEVVIAADLRHPGAADELSDGGRQFWTKAAALSAPLLIATMRAIFDRAFEPLAGGGRRVYVLIGSTSGAAAIDSDGSTGSLQASCPLASEMTTFVHTPSAGSRTDLMARTAATVIVHEYAHNADRITAWRLSGFHRSAANWFGEAFAAAAEETAARINSGQDISARETRITEAHAAYNRSAFVWGAKPVFSPFRGVGEYELGASLLLFSREVINDASVSATGPHLYQRLLQRDVPDAERWTLASLAAVLGSGPDDLLDRWSLAHATDDLVASPAAAAQALPQLRTWDHSDISMANRDATYRHPSRMVSRSVNTRRTLGAVPANYAAAYFFAEGGLGLSLSLSAPAPQARFRLTRLR